jgi:hypothetical protein
MRMPWCTNTHKSGSAARVRSDPKYASIRAFVPRNSGCDCAASNGPVQASRFQKHSHSSERALTLRTR